MTGRVVIVGLGPGAPALLTLEAQVALAGVSDVVGYGPYVDRVPARPGLVRHRFDNGEELPRARLALDLAVSGRAVAVVSAGDAGVFAMAAAVFEAIEYGEAEWRSVETTVVPGISAMFAAAARVGAPLGADFCAISLSDNLKPWAVVQARLRAAATAGFVMALYNPISSARPWQLGAAFDLLRGVLPGEAPVVFATAVSRPEERIDAMTLAEADPARADMRTLLLIGSAATRIVEAGGRRIVYSPRSVA